MIDLSGKNALVTGAGSGIGRQSAQTLAAAGAHVTCTDIEGASTEETAAMIRDAGGAAAAWQQDVVSEDQWTATVDRIVQDQGRIDILVNNAGIELMEPMTATTVDAFRRVMDINVLGVFLGIRTASAAMAAQGGGSIINMSSVAGLIGAPRQAAYCASKGGVRLMTKAAAMELGTMGAGVRVNSIHPGIIQTPMYETFFEGMDATARATREAQLMKAGVVGRLGVPTDIANAVLFLASDLSDFMTGAEMVVDGGMTAH